MDTSSLLRRPWTVDGQPEVTPPQAPKIADFSINKLPASISMSIPSQSSMEFSKQTEGKPNPVDAILNPGSTFATPAMNKMGFAPWQATGVGLALDLANPIGGVEGEGKKALEVGQKVLINGLEDKTFQIVGNLDKAMVKVKDLKTGRTLDIGKNLIQNIADTPTTTTK